jgi:hypothetical protein
MIGLSNGIEVILKGSKYDPYESLKIGMIDKIIKNDKK